MRARRQTAIVAIVVAIGMAGCSSKSATPSSSTSPTPTPSGPFTGVVLTAAEASTSGPPVTEALAFNGQGLQDITLDLCGLQYPSDLKRVDRLQVDYMDVQTKTKLIESNEIVRYNPGGAAQAYSELLAAKKKCPSTLKETNNDVLSHFVFHPAGQGFPTMTVFVTYDNAQSRGSPIGAAAIYMFDGNYLDGLYVYRMNTTDALNDGTNLGRIAAGKLRALAAG
ncbi:MAG TPA: hypothetical protein VJ818_02935 [Actinomycetota bacterium]|nr:hypothetical protein [Actinomycetota bacterium]